MRLWQDGLIWGLRDLCCKWRGLPRYGYGTLFNLKFGPGFRQRIRRPQ
jgi:hypothetical protein